MNTRDRSLIKGTVPEFSGRWDSERTQNTSRISAPRPRFALFTHSSTTEEALSFEQSRTCSTTPGGPEVVLLHFSTGTEIEFPIICSHSAKDGDRAKCRCVRNGREPSRLRFSKRIVACFPRSVEDFVTYSIATGWMNPSQKYEPCHICSNISTVIDWNVL